MGVGSGSRGRRGLVLGTALVGVFMAAAANAWACTPMARMSVGTMAAGPPRAVSVTGAQFGNAPVEIRWNSVTGPVVASAQGPDFSTTVPVPEDALSGVHYLVALQRNEGGSVAMKRTDTVDLTSGSGQALGATAASELWSDDEGRGTSNGSSSRVGVLLLASGLVVLGAGAAVPLVRRRARVPVQDC